MSNVAFLTEAGKRTPQVVVLSEDGDGLLITYPDGRTDWVAWWRLFRQKSEGSQQRYRRVDRPNWELAASSVESREILARARQRGLRLPFLEKLRWLYSLKVVVGAFLLLVTAAESVPATWAAAMVPEGVTQSLVDDVLAHHGSKQCTREGGERAVRKLLVALDPDLGKRVKFVALDYHGFVETSASTGTIVMNREILSELDVYAVAALLAHELSHLRHRDGHAAIIRENGVVATLAASIKGENDNLRLEFSTSEESRADREAIAMMQRAGLPIEPAANLFEQLRKEEAAGTDFALLLRRFHSGLPQRSREWQLAARRQPSAQRMMSQDEADNLFNFCWPGQIIPNDLRGEVKQPPPPPQFAPTFVEAGLGAIGPHPEDLFD